MKVIVCPMGGTCGGTGWEYVPTSDGPNPEPGHYVPCECNPYHLGAPDMPMSELRFYPTTIVNLKASDDAPF